MTVFVIKGPKGRLRLKNSGTQMFPTRESAEAFISKLPSPEKHKLEEVRLSRYSENDETILLSWQVAKYNYELLGELEKGMSLFVERDDRDKAIINEYSRAFLALDDLTHPALAAKAKRTRPDSPAGGSSETPEGRVILAAAEADMRAALQELFDISLEIEDRLPSISKTIQ